MQEFKRVATNEQVCAKLKLFLDQAEKGLMNFVGIIAVEGDKYSADFCGDACALYMANFGLDQLKNRVLQGVEATHIVPIPTGAPFNMYHYDISVEPCNFDFIVWLATIEMIRRRENAPAPLRIGFSTKDDQKLLSRESRELRNNFLVNVMGPALDLFGAVNDPEAVTKGRRSNMYTMKELAEGAKAGDEVPRIVPPQASMDAVADILKGRKPLVITLRENKDWEHRNSNMEGWLGFAKEMEAQGEDIIFVRDTAKAHEPLLGYETYPMASLDLHVRTALYEQAKCNFFVSNGPAFVAQMGTAPCLVFVTIRGDEPAPASRPEFWVKNQGIAAGEQLPWALPTQRYVWADDTFDNILKAWRDLNALEVKSPALPKRAGNGVGIQRDRSDHRKARSQGL